jgi:hypothetical protein
MTIQIEREARDCPHNDEVRAKGRSLGGSRILYDYKILIEGEFRAYAFGNGSGQRGFRLYDANRDPIVLSQHQPHHLGAEIDKKDDIIPIAAIALELGKIPTLDQLAANRVAKKEARNETARMEFARRVNGWKRHYGPELYQALVEIIAGASPGEFMKARAILDGIAEEIRLDVGEAPKIEP